MCGGDDEDEADSVHADGWRPFFVDREAADGLAGDESSLEPIEFTGGEELGDKYPLRRDNADRRILEFVFADFRRGNCSEGVELVEKLCKFSDHRSAKANELWVLEKLFVCRGVVCALACFEWFGMNGV